MPRCDGNFDGLGAFKGASYERPVRRGIGFQANPGSPNAAAHGKVHRIGSARRSDERVHTTTKSRVSHELAGALRYESQRHPADRTIDQNVRRASLGQSTRRQRQAVKSARSVARALPISATTLTGAAATVNGHRFLPTGGHEIPHWWPSFLPAGGHQIFSSVAIVSPQRGSGRVQVRGVTPLPAVLGRAGSCPARR
jgi:hypothetical protein